MKPIFSNHLTMVRAMVLEYLPLRIHLLWVVPLTFFIALVSIIEPYMYYRVVDWITTGQELSNGMGFVLIWIVLLGLSIFGEFFRDYKFHRILQKHWQVVVSRALDVFLTRSYAYHLQVNNSEKIKICNRAVDASYDCVHQLVLNIPKQVTVFLGYIVLALLTNWQLTLCIFAFLPVLMIAPLFVWNLAHEAQKSASKKWDAVYGGIGDAIMNIAIVSLFARRKQINKEVATSVDLAATEQSKVSIYWAALEAGGQSIQAILSIFTLGISLYFYSKQLLTIGELVLFLTVAGRITGPFLQLEASYRNISRSIAQYTQFYEVAQKPAEKNEGSEQFPLNFTAIEFENVDFSYEEFKWEDGKETSRKILDGISFSIQKNTKIALVGQTGSGKSTISQLLMRFYSPLSGGIFLQTPDSRVDISAIELDNYRSHFSAVFQDTTLFNRSLRDNLAFVRDGIDDAMIESACRQANIWDFISKLPEWLDTLVGERWLKLSGGEKQRIAIARSILANPEILVLDEATSALDSQTEKLVTEALEKLMEGRTSIVIAHRLSTIVRADSILLVDAGKIVAQGTHEELYKTREEYRKMVDLHGSGESKGTE
jgi:ABC-type multidrug transport system fused ATPase/permease subunit